MSASVVSPGVIDPVDFHAKVVSENATVSAITARIPRGYRERVPPCIILPSLLAQDQIWFRICFDSGGRSFSFSPRPTPFLTELLTYFRPWVPLGFG